MIESPPLPSKTDLRVSRSRSSKTAEPLALFLLAPVLIALALRLPNLDVYTLSLPEGIRLEQLMLLSAGYQACLDIFCNQGPLALQAMHPTFVLFGETLAAARSSALIASIIGLLATCWVAWTIWDRPTAAAVGLLLAISPTYLKFSRLALPEMVALAPALLAVGAAASYRRSGALVWLLAASVLYALSLLIKPVAAPAIVPIALLVLGRYGVRRRDILLAAGLCIGVVLLGGVFVGLGSIWEQVVFRWQSRLAEGRPIEWNLAKILDELTHDQVGIFALAAAGAVVLGKLDRQALTMTGGWLLASLALLLIHTPLHDKHILIMLPPTALLAGRAVSELLRWVSSRRRAEPEPGSELSAANGAALLGARAGDGRDARAPSKALVVAACGIGALLYLASLPGLITRNTVLAQGSEMIEPDPAQHWYEDASRAVAVTTAPRSFVVTDFPYIAFGANRLVPPQLVESSLTRIRAGSLTDEIAIAEASRFNPQAVLLWWDRLIRLPGFKRWVDERYSLVRVYAADEEAVTGLYLPRDSDLGRVRPALSETAFNRSGAQFGNGLVVDRWGIDDTVAQPGSQRSVTVLWQATAPQRRDLAGILTLRTPDRVVWTSQRLPLLGPGDGQRQWAADRWIVWSGLVRVPRNLAPGSYLLSLRVAEGAGDLLSLQPGGAALELQDPKGLELTVLQVTAGSGGRR